MHNNQLISAATGSSQSNQIQNENPQQNIHRLTRRLNFSHRIPLLYKLIIAACFILGYTIYRIFYIPFDNSQCLRDTYFEATWNANRWMRYHGGTVLIGIGQVLMDGWLLFLGTAWFILCKNIRFPLAAGIIFLFRTFFLTIEKVPFNDYIVWHSPGFFSITVPYDRTRDFFFSGHTSTLSIVTLELINFGWYPVAALAFLSLIFMMNMLIISRIHYTTDIMAALIFTAVVYRLVTLVLPYIDYILSIPFYIGRFIFRKIKKQQDQQQIQLLNHPGSSPQTQQQMKHKQQDRL